MRKDHLTSKSLPFNLSNSFLRRKFMNIGIRQGWWSEDKPIVLAVSGGSDSVAMLWFFHEFWTGKIIVAHLEHGIRGQDSINDADFVKFLCTSWGLDCEVEHRSVPDLKEKGESTEEAARRVRYEFLYSVIDIYQASLIAVAHNSDDQAETVIHNLTRGTGPFGLVGIPEKRERIVRPVIDFYREELREILRSRNISWCEDLTNDDIAMTRNRIRHKLLPWIEKNINAQAKKHIIDLAGNMTFFRELEEDRSRSIRIYLERRIPGSIYSFDLHRARKLKNEDLVIFIRSIGRTFGMTSLSRKRLDNLVTLIRDSGRWRFQWQDSIELCAGKGFVGLVDTDVFMEQPALSITFPEEEVMGECFWNGWKIEWETIQQGFTNPGSGSRQAIMPLAEQVSLQITSHAEFCSGSKFQSIPWWIRKAWPVLSLGSRVFWFPSLSDNDNSSLVSKGKIDKFLRITVLPVILMEGV